MKKKSTLLNKILKIAAIFLFLLFAGVIGLLTYVTKFKPSIPLEDVKIEYTPDRIKRGEYLANNVTQCMACHSTRDYTKFSGPPILGTEGKGGDMFDREHGLPGVYYAPNITPYHLKDWSDAELFRAITAGVSRDGHPLFPMMPYLNFGKMDREDVYSIIAYIRSLPSVENDIPPSESDFPMNILIHIIPTQAEFSQMPSPADKIKYGEYLTNVASCADCHTPTKSGLPDDKMKFAGGNFISMPDGSRVVSANITPDKQTGIGNWSEETFVQKFKAFETNAKNGTDAVRAGEFNSIMPWSKYAQMSESDLAAIYAYLQTRQPVANKVEKNFYPKK